MVPTLQLPDAMPPPISHPDAISVPAVAKKIGRLLGTFQASFLFKFYFALFFQAARKNSGLCQAIKSHLMKDNLGGARITDTLNFLVSVDVLSEEAEKMEKNFLSFYSSYKWLLCVD